MNFGGYSRTNYLDSRKILPGKLGLLDSQESLSLVIVSRTQSITLSNERQKCTKKMNALTTKI